MNPAHAYAIFSRSLGGRRRVFALLTVERTSEEGSAQRAGLARRSAATNLRPPRDVITSGDGLIIIQSDGRGLG